MPVGFFYCLSKMNGKSVHFIFKCRKKKAIVIVLPVVNYSYNTLFNCGLSLYYTDNQHDWHLDRIDFIPAIWTFTIINFNIRFKLEYIGEKPKQRSCVYWIGSPKRMRTEKRSRKKIWATKQHHSASWIIFHLRLYQLYRIHIFTTNFYLTYCW